MLYYKGNSIIHWANKAMAYNRTLSELWDILGPVTEGPMDIRELVKKLVDEVEKYRASAHNIDYAMLKDAYITGYEAGHHDTVESCYGSSDDKADDWISENFA
jgi:hypothetical protein